MAGQQLHEVVDIVILGLYFFFVMLIGLWASCRKGRETVKGYFLAGRNMTWLPIGFSLFASNIGSEHFIGLAGSGAKSGIAVVAFEWGAVLLLLMLGWLFLPIYLTSGIYTMPEFLERRFGTARIRMYLSLVSTVLYIATKISVDIYAGAVFIQQALGWNTYIAISILLVITAIFTIAGGLSAVVLTDTLQTVIMLTGSVILAVLAYVEVGGFLALQYKYFEAVPLPTNATMNTTCGLPRDDAFHILRDPVHSDLPWPGVIIRSTLCSLWYWCTDQVIVQRTLAAKNLAHARGATIVAGYLKILPLFLIIIPGMISRVLFTEEVACVDPEICIAVCDNAAGCSNIAYPKLVLDLAPVGLKGLMMAVMMSALISSLTSVFNSAATLFTIDIWTRYRKQASEKELLIIGRLFVVFLVGVSIAWIPLIKSSEEAQLFFYIQKVTGYIAPPVCAIFLLAVLVPFINEKGAFWGMLTGQMFGVTRLVLDFIFTSPKCGEPDLRPDIVSKFHFTYFSSALFGFTAIVTILISAFTKRPTPVMLNGLTIWSVHRFGLQKNRMTLRRKRIIEGSTRSDVSFHRHLSYDRPYIESIGLDDRYSTLTSSVSSTVDTHEEEMRERHKEMLTIPSTAKLFININAIVLLCVFIMCYAIFG